MDFPLAAVISTLASLLFGPLPQGRCEQHTLRYDGDVNIGILVNLHHSSSSKSDGFNLGNRDESSNGGCGVINSRVLQQTVAAKWAVDVINNRSLSDELRIGLQLHDTCESGDLVEEHLFQVITGTRSPSSDFRMPATGPPIIGVISLGSSKDLREVAGALYAFNVPFVSVTLPEASAGGRAAEDALLGKYDNLLTTVPDRAGQITALVEVARSRGFKSVSLVSSSHDASRIFVSEATAAGVAVPRVLELGSGSRADPAELAEQVRMFVLHSDSSRPVVALVTSGQDEARILSEHLRPEDLGGVRPTWLVCSVAGASSVSKATGWRRFFHGGVFVEPYMPELDDFKEYFVESLQSPSHNLKDLMEEYKEEVYQCSVGPTFNSFQTSCNDVPRREIDLRFHQDPYVSFVVKAVSALVAAFRLVQLERCSPRDSGKKDCLRRTHDTLHEDIVDNLRKLTFASMTDGGKGKGRGKEKGGGSRHHFSKGRLVANKQQIYAIDREDGLEQIGWYTPDGGLNLIRPTRNDDNNNNFNSNGNDNSVDRSIFTRVPDNDATGSRSSPRLSSPPEEQNRRSTFARAITGISVPPQQEETEEETRIIDPLQTSVSEVENLQPVLTSEGYLSRAWALIVLSIAVCGFLVAFVMLLYVSQRVCSNLLMANSQLMGILLLVGVMGLFVSVFPWLLLPTPSVCVTRHILHPLLLVVCFAILLVKAMHLRSLLTIGLGGSIPQINQLLSLLFMVTVQLVIVIEWYISVSPIKVANTDYGVPYCEVSRLRFFLLHFYPCVLMLLAFFYGVSVVNFKSNFNEGRLIAFTLILAIPTVAIWLIVQNFANEALREAAIAVGIVLTALIILCVIFLPKMWAINRESHLAKKRSSVYSQWPQWNSSSKQQQQQQQWHPQRWFASYKPSAYRPFSDLASHHPFYTASSSNGSHSQQESFFRAPDPNRPLLPHRYHQRQPQQHFQHSPVRRRVPLPNEFPIPSPRKARSRHRSSPRENNNSEGEFRRRRRATSSHNNREESSPAETNFFTVGAPQSYYYYGDRGRSSRAETRQKSSPRDDKSRNSPNSASPRRYATPTSAKRSVAAQNTHQVTERRYAKQHQGKSSAGVTTTGASRIPCRCCSQGSQKIAQISAAVSTNRGRSINSSLPSLVGMNDGEVSENAIIIAPDNLQSYGGESHVWSQKYETR